jgi:hypothetical protein
MCSMHDSQHRYLVLLGHWTEPLQATLMDQHWAERVPCKWRHPSKYGMVKQLIVGTGEIGTRAIQDIWLMRRQARTQLDAYMATPTADILEHERAHIPRLPHAVQPFKDACEKAMDNSRTNNTEPVLTDPECRILTYRLLQRDPKHRWQESHKRTFSNRSGKRVPTPIPELSPTLGSQVVAHSRHQALDG